MIKIPLSQLPDQEFVIVLAKQNCTIHLYQRGGRMYLDLQVGQTQVQQGALVIPKTSLISVSNCVFSGQLRIIDTKRTPFEQEPPHYSELGSRFVLYYLTDAEVKEFGLK